MVVRAMNRSWFVSFYSLQILHSYGVHMVVRITSMIKSSTSEAKRQYNEARMKKRGWVTLLFIMNNRCKTGKHQGGNTDSLYV
jgi:hypothetical protein